MSDEITGYENEYHKNRHRHLYTNQYYYKARSELAKKRYFNGIDDLDKKIILEFGMGLGQNLFWLPAHRRIGYDISKFAINFFKSKGGMATNNINKIPDNSIDIIFSAHVLEHVENPLETLNIIKSKLKKGGKLIIVTPLDKVKKVNSKDVNQHLWTWTPQLMNNLLVKSGFQPVENKIISSYAYKKLLPFRKLGIITYDYITRFAGIIFRDKELKFVAVKR